MGLWRAEITSLMFSDMAALGCVASVVTSHSVLSQDQVSPQGDVMLQYWGKNLLGQGREEFLIIQGLISDTTQSFRSMYREEHNGSTRLL